MAAIIADNWLDAGGPFELARAWRSPCDGGLDIMAAMPLAPVANRDVPSNGMSGVEWIIDAYGCDPAALRDRTRLETLFARLVVDLQLTPVAAPVWHTFPPPGGITGFVVLAESHLSCHTFPEFESICVNVFCCRPRTGVDPPRVMADVLGASRTLVRCVERAFSLPAPVIE
jgi:S-adenosylmethionine decarboxylase